MNILIADDHTMIRNALSFLINQQEDMTVVTTAATGYEVALKLEQMAIDVMLLDISMPPGENGLVTAKRVKAAFPNVKIVILTMHDDEEYIKSALKSQVDGYILKSASDEVLIECIRKVMIGARVFQGYSEEALKQLSKDGVEDLYDTLSKREKEILPLVALGHHNKEISEMLFISVKTVEAHKRNIKKKLQLNTYADIVSYAIKQHLVDY